MVISKAKGKPRLKRAEKAEHIRNSLLHAAAEVIGDQGYLNAMILTITQRAKVANGTFYNYFDSQQDLFDQLLPKIGRELLDFIDDRTVGDDEIARELSRFQAFLDYSAMHPEFYRILYEAEVFAPEAFKVHIEQVVKGYAGVLRRATQSGDIIGYSSKELNMLALILMGARHYISMYYSQMGNDAEGVPQWVLDTYAKFIKGGLRAIVDTDA